MKVARRFRPVVGGAIAAAALAATLTGCDPDNSTTNTTRTTPASSTSAIPTTPASHAATTAPPTRHPAPATTRPAANLPAPPTTGPGDSGTIDICPGGTITGNLGKQMQVAVIETANGYAGCTEAFNVLSDYYVLRPRNLPDSTPIVVDNAWNCNQLPEPDLAQVSCINAQHFVIFSMWPQT